MILLDLGGDDPEPHPDLVASQRPAPAQVVMATMETGWLSDGRYLTAAVPWQRTASAP